MVDQQSFSFGFKVLRLFSQNRGTYILNPFMIILPQMFLKQFSSQHTTIISLFQDTRKRKGLKEGLPDLQQYLDKL